MNSHNKRILIPLAFVVIAMLISLLVYYIPFDPYNQAEIDDDAATAFALIIGLVLFVPITLLEFIPNHSHNALGRVFRITACLILIPITYSAFSDYWWATLSVTDGFVYQGQFSWEALGYELQNSVSHNVVDLVVLILVVMAILWRRGEKLNVAKSPKVQTVTA